MNDLIQLREFSPLSFIAIRVVVMGRIVALALSAACLSGCVSVNKGSRPLGSIVGQMERTPQPGDWCRVTYPPTAAGSTNFSREMTGRVNSVDEEGVHLSDVVVTDRSQKSTPVVSRVPYMGRYFKNTGVGVERADSEQVVRPDEFERLEIITKEQAWQPNAQLLAQRLTNAVPVPHRTP